MADTIEQRTRKRAASTTAIVAELQAHASEIHKQGVTSLALFGSRARGDERKESDLDVLIGYDPERPFTLYELVRIERLAREPDRTRCACGYSRRVPPAPLAARSEGRGQRALMPRSLDLIVE